MSETPSKLISWINSKYLKDSKTFSQGFLEAKPFPHLELKDFFKELKTTQILQALADEDFHLKDADLFTFYQTSDLISSKNKILQEFRSVLISVDFIRWLSSITKLTLKPGVIDISATLYDKTHHLLPHDDQLEGRKIAFFLYLSDLTKKDGGALALYQSTNNVPIAISTRIYPRLNTFAFFEVSGKSFHEVEEIITNKQRIAISGWFHEN